MGVFSHASTAARSKESEFHSNPEVDQEAVALHAGVRRNVRRRLYDAPDGRPPFVFFSHPVAVKEIFTGDPDILLAGRGNQVLEPILGPNSVALLDGARHRRGRKLLMRRLTGSE